MMEVIFQPMLRDNKGGVYQIGDMVAIWKLVNGKSERCDGVFLISGIDKDRVYFDGRDNLLLSELDHMHRVI